MTTNPNMTLKKKEKKKEPSAEPKMTLKKKAEIKNVSKQESPEYRKKSHPKNVTTNKRWVENTTFKQNSLNLSSFDLNNVKNHV